MNQPMKKDLWEKIDGKKRAIGIGLFGLGVVCLFIPVPFVQATAMKLLSVGGTLWGIGQIHHLHKKESSHS